jgi:chemotaxis response regulator CheB
MTSLSNTLKARASGILLSGLEKMAWRVLAQLLKGGGNAIVQDPNTCLCNDTTAMTAQKYGLSRCFPGSRMAEAIQMQCLDTSH